MCFEICGDFVNISFSHAGKISMLDTMMKPKIKHFQVENADASEAT